VGPGAGILRDKTFAKLELADFRKVVEVHLMGTVNCTKAVWETMRDQAYGRIVMTTSSSGLFGNFGQSNYGAAKAAVVGLMNVLCLEGAKSNIRVNALAPAAATRMLEGLIPAEAKALLAPELVSPGVLFLASEDAPSRVILGAGAGSFAVTRLYETPGVYLGRDVTVDEVAAHWGRISAREGEAEQSGAFMQTDKFLELALQGLGAQLRPAGVTA